MIEFKYTYLLVFVFYQNLHKVYLTNNSLTFSYFNVCKDRLNGFTIEPKINEQENITISKFFFDQFNLKIDPSHWKHIINLQNIEKIWKFKIYTIYNNIEIENVNSYLVKDLPIDGLPFIKWVVPMCLDFMIYKSDFNQVLIN